MILPDDNMYNTIKLIEIPYITTRFELTVQAMRAMVTAPGWLANLKDAELLARVERIKKFMREHQPINDYELALKLQLANLMPELVSKEERRSRDRDALAEAAAGRRLVHAAHVRPAEVAAGGAPPDREATVEGGHGPDRRRADPEFTRRRESG